MRYYQFIILFIIGCSNILYNHNDTMSMLVSKQMVMDKFGEPSELIKREGYDEYYYDFGVFEERVNYFDPQISTVSQQSDSVYSPANVEVAPQFRIQLTQKYIKFHIAGDEVIYWESQAVNFPTKKMTNCYIAVTTNRFKHQNLNFNLLLLTLDNFYGS